MQSPCARLKQGHHFERVRLPQLLRPFCPKRPKKVRKESGKSLAGSRRLQTHLNRSPKMSGGVSNERVDVTGLRSSVQTFAGPLNSWLRGLKFVFSSFLGPRARRERMVYTCSCQGPLSGMDLSAPKWCDSLRLRRFLPLPSKSCDVKLLGPKMRDISEIENRQRTVILFAVKTDKADSDCRIPCDNRVCGGKSLANGDVRFWCIQVWTISTSVWIQRVLLQCSSCTLVVCVCVCVCVSLCSAKLMVLDGWVVAGWLCSSELCHTRKSWGVHVWLWVWRDDWPSGDGLAEGSLT